ncbi:MULTISPECIES: N-acetyltransferase [unclassified Enterococcus]|uniref:GNAT family N-acetyltransferase n=1 Tax=unclassified Enterococcus TaxID=2608891 RepID=UPI0013ECDDC2|nr:MULTISPECIES: N-acetyltransferase [unclassified Enterococcus]
MIEELDKKNVPWTLLLEADPDEEKVAAYIETGEGFIWKEKNEIAGVLVYTTRQTEFEIMNLSVAEKEQGKGIGGQLLDAAFALLSARAETQKRILVRTGSTSNAALHLYRKKGYQEISREKDYFIKNYPQPIFENGERLRDQITLANEWKK